MSRLSFACALALFASLSSPAAQLTAGKSYAVVVGVADYDHANFGKLACTENDAEKLAEVLGRAGSPFAGRVRVLTCTRGRKKADDAPTAANIRKAVAELAKGKRAGDTVLVALAGHGLELVVPDPAGKHPAKAFAMFAPQDVDTSAATVDYASGKAERLVNLEGILGELGGSGAGTRLVMVDACREVVNARNLDAGGMKMPKNTVLLLACKSDQRSFESRKLGHGVFFHFVIKGLRGEPDATNKAGAVTYDRLSAYVREQVRENVGELIGGGATQDPREYRGDFGDAVLLPPAKESAVRRKKDESGGGAPPLDDVGDLKPTKGGTGGKAVLEKVGGKKNDR